MFPVLNNSEKRSCQTEKCTNLDLGEGDLEAKALIEVRIQSVLFDRRLLLLQPLAVVLQHHLNKGI